MKWNNLKENKCPQCGKSLVNAWNPSKNMFVCLCGFMIGQKRFKEIVSGQIKRKIEEGYGSVKDWQESEGGER